MFVGIDVGGTYTDAVLLENNQVRAIAKVPTREILLDSLIEAIDIIVKDEDKKKVKRIVFSTTIITNLIAEKKYEDVDLLIIPGPGLSHDYYKHMSYAHIIPGAIDYRGREILSLKEQEIEAVLREIAAKGSKKVGVVGKFSPRNTSHEKQVAGIIKNKYPDWQVELGSKIGSQLNFPRRVVTTYLTCATREPYHYFIESVRQALKIREIYADVFILKADGGTTPLQRSEELPVETIFSGPAASTLGVQALTSPGETAVVVDIGGTTTDLALILSGQPLLSAKGARVMDQLTQVRALAVKSVPIGGDSVLNRDGNEINICGKRMGQAYCLGGPAPTPTDALRVLGLTDLGDRDKAAEAMTVLGEGLNITVDEIAGRVVTRVVDIITAEIEKMFIEWEQEPAYRVWEIIHKHAVKPTIVAGVGGGAAGFAVRIAKKLGCRPVIPQFASVANAIGAALAKPTLQVNLRADTERGYYIIQEEGYQEKISDRDFNENKALELAKNSLLKRASKYGLELAADEIEVTRLEVFNMIRGWDTTGRLYDITVQTPRGIVSRIGVGE
jgi:N-methylhydantoinase A/oxoprolinase/acetone carboxylase beta subunit